MTNDFDRMATQSEAYCEMVQNIGADNADKCWILTPFDTWERNPAYTGPDVPHPEDDFLPEDFLPEGAPEDASGDFVDHVPDPFYDAAAYDDDLALYNANEADDYRNE